MAERRKIVAVLRAVEDARVTSARLADLGFEVALAPVFAAVALAPEFPRGRFDAVATTSAKALEFAPEPVMAAARGLALYVVGSAGRRAAENRRLTVAGQAQDAAALAEALVAELPRGAHVLYLAGANRKTDLESALAVAGFGLETLEVYDARPRGAWHAGEAEAVADADAVLHYSRRSAELATGLAERAGIAARWQAMLHIAISADAAAPLRAVGVESVRVARAPNEAAMFALLEDERWG